MTHRNVGAFPQNLKGRGNVTKASSRGEKSMSVMDAVRRGPTTVRLSEDDAVRAARLALRDAGYTFDDLVRQAASGDFETIGAQLTWQAVRHIGDPGAE